MTSFEEVLAMTPKALEEYVNLPELGGRMIVYEGPFTLRNGEEFYKIQGCFFYSFCEHINLFFEGQVLSSSGIELWRWEISSESGWRGTAIVTQLKTGKGPELIRGQIEYAYQGQEECRRWRWCYLNAPVLLGENVVYDGTLSKDRLTFHAGGYKIIIDNRPGYIQQKQHRSLSHICELKRMDGAAISKDDALQEIRLFSSFFSFVAGCRHAPFFIQGYEEQEAQFQWHGLGMDNSLTRVSSWKPDYKDLELIPLWSAFRRRYYASSDCAEVLLTLVHWYLEANMNSGLLEGAYLLGFAGLELASDVMVGKRRNNADKVQAFWDMLHLSSTQLPEDIASMRNGLMHYTKTHRLEYSSLRREDKIIRLESLLQILELAILYWLNYEGHYSDRLNPGWRGTSTRRVPWAGA